MSQDTSNEVPQVTLRPRCGHCGAGADGRLPLAMIPEKLGPMIVGVFMCGNPDCATVHSVQVLEMMTTAGPSPEAQKPLIVKPS